MYACPHNPRDSASSALSTRPRAISGVGPSNRVTMKTPFVGWIWEALVAPTTGLGVVAIGSLKPSRGNKANSSSTEASLRKNWAGIPSVSLRIDES